MHPNSKLVPGWAVSLWRPSGYLKHQTLDTPMIRTLSWTTPICFKHSG
uniref:Uncharacterized protein n=1 Tax=Anguilla anguilla TaxID=7936 RepID=A0A0E9WVE2_ANGAN